MQINLRFDYENVCEKTGECVEQKKNTGRRYVKMGVHVTAPYTPSFRLCSTRPMNAQSHTKPPMRNAFHTNASKSMERFFHFFF